MIGSQITPISSGDEQSEAERLEIARRYRGLRTRELRETAAKAVDGEVQAAGEFATLAFASYAAIPLLGIFFAVLARWRASLRNKLPERVLLALDEAHLYALERRPKPFRPDAPVRAPEVVEVVVAQRWPRDSIRVTSVEDRFLSTEVVFDTGEGKPLKLYAPRLTSNPWSAEVVRLLGGDAPQPRDLGGEPAEDGSG